MPHTAKKEYQKMQETPKLDPDTEVFYLSSTKEVFTEYEDYFERVIQLNSCCWICSITGKAGLTYDEALESEKEAMDQISNFPGSLRAPVLYSINMFSHRARIDDLVSDILLLIKDRYFLNEEIQFKDTNNSKVSARIAGITYSPSSNGKSKSSNSKNKSSNSNSPKKKQGEDASSTDKTKCETVEIPSPECFKYSLKILKSEDSNSDSDESIIDGSEVNESQDISHPRISRINTITKPKLKLFIKFHTTISSDHIVVKHSSVTEFHLDQVKWGQIFAGPSPKFPRTQRTLKKADKASTSGAAERDKPSTSKAAEQKILTKKPSNSSEKSKSLTTTPSKSLNKKAETKQKLQKIVEQQSDLLPLFQMADKHGVENMRRWRQNSLLLKSTDVDALRNAIAEAKEMERKRQIEKRRREREELLSWKKPRDDLQCDDLKPFPKYRRLIWPEWIPRDCYMDLLSIHNFFTSFAQILPNFPTPTKRPFNLWELALALVSGRMDDTAHFFRVLKFLLEAIRDCINEDEGDEADLTRPEELGTELHRDIDHPVHGQAIRSINQFHSQLRDQIHGSSVRFMKLEYASITEVIRLSLQTSGFYTWNRRLKRGGMKCFEDDGYKFVRKNPEIMELLEKSNVFALTPSQRVQLLNTFLQQLLSHSKFRQVVDDRIDELCELRRKLKQLRQTEIQNEKEARETQILRDAKAKESAENNPPADNKEAPAKKNPSKDILNLRRFLINLNDGRRVLNMAEMKERFLNQRLPFDEMESNEINEFRTLQRNFFNERIEEVQQSMFDLQAQMGLCYLGKDRAFRHYFFVHHFSILIIQSPSRNGVGECGDPTPIERDQKKSPKHETGIKSLDILSVNEQKTKEDSDEESYIGSTETDDEEQSNMANVDPLMACSGRMSDCPVHNPPEGIPELMFYLEEDGLKKLLTALNPRGYREIELTENINQFKDLYSAGLDRSAENFDSERINKLFGLYYPQQDLTTLLNSFINDNFETDVRKQLLDMEQQIHEKQLGVLQSSANRDVWRDALEETGDTSAYCLEGIMRLKQPDFNEVLYSAERLCEGNLSTVQKLGIALLQIFHGVGMECLKESPFAAESRKDQSIKPTLTYVEWQKALTKCQSPSAISLFATTLAAAIEWNYVKSPSKCPQCLRWVKTTEKQQVQCEECKELFHWKCVRPKYSRTVVEDTVPDAGWQCRACLGIDEMDAEETSTGPQNGTVGEEEADADTRDEETVLPMKRKRVSKKRIDYSPTPSPSSSNVSVDMRNRDRREHSTSFFNSHNGVEDDEDYLPESSRGRAQASSSKSIFKSELIVTGSRKRKPVTKYGEFVFSDDRDPGTDSNDSMREFFALHGHNKEKRRRRETTSDGLKDEFHLRSVGMGLRETGAGRSRKELLKLWENILYEARKQHFAEPFADLVDRKEYPQYYEVVMSPMALQQIIRKIKNYEYNTTEDVWADCELIFKNCEAYNGADNPITEQCNKLRDFLKQKFEQI